MNWCAPSISCWKARALEDEGNPLESRGREEHEEDVGKDSETDSQASKQTDKRHRNEELGDFTTSLRVIPISLLAMAIGIVCAYVALALLRLIGLFTNLFYFGRWNSAM